MLAAGLSSLFLAGLGCRIIFGDDFKKPAWGFDQLPFLPISSRACISTPDSPFYRSLSDQSPPSTSAARLQPHSRCDGRSSRHGRSGNSGPCTSCPAVTVSSACIPYTPQGTDGCIYIPFIQPHRVLDEQQSLIRQQRRTQRGRQVQSLEKHLAKPASLSTTPFFSLDWVFWVLSRRYR